MRISDIRKSNHMTQKELAIACGVSSIAISRYETGKRIPNIETAFKLAKALNCTVDDLIDKNQD